MPNQFYNFTADLDKLNRQSLYRKRRIVDGAQGVLLNLEGRRLNNFCSNDYLGLANHPQVTLAFKQAVDLYGVGSGSAHLICGHSREHHELEAELAAFTGRDRTLLFSTGYMANMGVISALLGRHDAVYEDRLNHASLLDGGLLSKAGFNRYRHADVADLSEKLALSQAKALIVSDGVFSMDGDLAPVPELADIAGRFQAGLLIDDAHGFGVLGETGGGVAEHFQLDQQQLPILIGTLGKAFGSFGAFVAGSADLIEMMIQHARTYIYTTSLPSAVAAATRASLKLLVEESWRRQKLQNLLHRFRNNAIQLNIPISNSFTAIQPIIIGDSHKALQISELLLEQGFLVSAIRPPTVPKGTARLRITFSANHEEWQVDSLLEALAKAIA